jgi:arylsulfatase A-like enzyme
VRSDREKRKKYSVWDLGYDLAAAYSVNVIRRFVNDLDKRGVLNDSLLVIYGDHGVVLSNKPHYSKYNGYDDETHVPVIYWSPRINSSSRIDAVSGLVDFAPTLCDYLGFGDVKGFHGRSVLHKQYDVNDYTVFEYLGAGPADFALKKICLAIRTGRYKFICREKYTKDKCVCLKNQELYDIINDPDELNDLFGNSEYIDICAKMEEMSKNGV